jgi:hypothetical protein
VSNLSPAAQAVLDALIDGRAEAAVGPQKRITWWNDRVGLAAALRAAVEETQGKVVCPTIEMVTTNHRYCLASDILAIADELEAQ